MPTQNLTIMFTDIKGFTERTSGSTRAGMNNLLAEHERLLVPVFQYFDGRIVKTIGDAFLVTFASPTDAVLCGVTIQEVLRQYNLGADESVRIDVRVAINVGEVEVRDNDVLGEPVNIAARLEGATEAGEVYFTEAVYQTMNRSEAPSADVGERIFKGIPYPIRVYRVLNEPGSELATRLANGVRLSERGPVLAGIRDAIDGKRLKRNVMVASAAVLLVLLIAAMLLQPDPSGIEPAVSAQQPQVDDPARLLQRDAELAVSEALNNPEYSGQYRPRPIQDFLDRHRGNPAAAAQVDSLLAGRGEAMTRLWLQGLALEQGLVPGKDVFDWNIGLQQGPRIDWQMLDASRELLLRFYPQETRAWAATALQGAEVMAFMNAWRVLEETGDAPGADPALAALHSLIGASDVAVVDSAREILAQQQDPAQRARILGFSAQLVDSFPRFLNHGDVRDAIAAMRALLAASWNF
jgi:class 3 adenylate cyclase